MKIRQIAMGAGLAAMIGFLGAPGIAAADEPSEGAARSLEITQPVSASDDHRAQRAHSRPLDRRHRSARGRSGRWW